MVAQRVPICLQDFQLRRDAFQFPFDGIDIRLVGLFLQLRNAQAIAIASELLFNRIEFLLQFTHFSRAFSGRFQFIIGLNPRLISQTSKLGLGRSNHDVSVFDFFRYLLFLVLYLLEACPCFTCLIQPTI